jgi:protein-disulfide isomerase
MGTLLNKTINENDHYQGNLNAPVGLVEYGDFECPYSGVAARVIDQLLAEYDSNLCFAFRHFPLAGIHPEAEFAALSSEAAAEQNHFWEMHKLLFENQEHLSKNLIELLARKLRLDMDKFLHDMQRNELLEKVRSQHQSGKESGVEATPVIYINGQKYEGSSTYWPLREAIELELSGPAQSASY